MSFLEENKAVVRRLFEAVNTRNTALLYELMAPDFIDNTLQLRGPEANIKLLTMFLKAFPDWHETIEDIIAEGDKVWVHFKSTGTHAGEFQGLAPTGKKFTETGVLIYRVVDGKIAEGWTVSDVLDFFKQIGVIKYTEKGKKLFPEEAKRLSRP
jgi:predicted ester cyclase